MADPDITTIVDGNGNDISHVIGESARVIGPSTEDLEICSRCNRPRGMHLYMTFRNDWYKGHEGYEVWVCAELLPQFEGHPK